MRLREFNAEIRAGNVLVLSCQGIENGKEHCCGMLRVPFDPPLPGCNLATYNGKKYDRYWSRSAGETVDDLTLVPSIDAGACGHFNVTAGEVVKHGK